MNNDQGHGDSFEIVLAFLIGAALVSVADPQLTTQSAADSPEQLPGYTERIGDAVESVSGRVNETFTEVVNQGKEMLEEMGGASSKASAS
ncbi:hypothetical protein W02_10320 [Nitrospira sp. KM1]|uniref:hypothetical protein n=1 Tax=Nitrospira sp. KM1 TaxID=1936990 RepID=UPI0013A78FEC|nr:hypothetical protein [Nitrospira sp. KM1]BCA53892.1 hypothetical protein W02_10320 [Nitrospira sp. KM1]